MVSNGTTANYKYDGLGRRVEKDVVSATTKVTRFIYDNEDILLELDGSNNILSRYTHGPGIDEPLILEKGGASFFYHADGLGSIIELTDATGAVAKSYSYSSFGKIESETNPALFQPYTFTGREFDSETGLYFYRARYYDLNIGRFLQEDPVPGLTSQSLNRYAYVRNNPPSLFDANGKEAVAATIGLSFSFPPAAIPLVAVGVGIGAYAATSTAIQGTWLGEGGIGNWVYDITHPGPRNTREGTLVPPQPPPPIDVSGSPESCNLIFQLCKAACDATCESAIGKLACKLGKCVPVFIACMLNNSI